MSFYPVQPVGAISGVVFPGGDRVSVMVAVPVAGLSWPVVEGSGGDGRSAMLVGGAGKIKSGDVVAFCKVVVVAAARVRRDGRVQAQGRPCDHARLGAAEVELDAVCGPDTIERVAAGVRLTGARAVQQAGGPVAEQAAEQAAEEAGGGAVGTARKRVQGMARREMSVAFTIRAVLLMTLMPGADARQVMATLLGDLPGVPWQREHVVPSATVLSSWRTAIGSEPLRRLQRQWLAVNAVTTDHSHIHDHSDIHGHSHDGDGNGDGGHGGGVSGVGIDVGGGLRVGAIDGTVTRMPDTSANRARFGSAGASGSGYPQIRSLHANDAFTRATRAVVTGPAGGDKAEAEQTLLDRLLVEHAAMFTKNQVWVMDRNFPGVPRIAVMTGITHVLIRVKSDIRLERLGDFLPDGSWLARMSGGGVSLTVRVIEYHARLDGQTTPELFALITDLLDHQTHPADLLAAAYRWRWDGSETALREGKSTLHGSGPGTGAMLRSHTPDLIEQEHAAWTTATALVRATVQAAATAAAPFTKGPRTGQPVQARHLSYTAATRTVIATVAAGTATASLPTPAKTAAHHTALRQIATAKVTTDRNRHRPRKIKSSQPFGHAPTDITTTTTPVTIHNCGAAA